MLGTFHVVGLKGSRYPLGSHPLQQTMLGLLQMHLQKLNLDPYLTPQPIINSKWSMDLNATAQTITLLEKNTGLILCNLVLGNGVLDTTSKVQLNETQ